MKRTAPEPDRRRRRRPLDQAALEQLALRYVGRYATTRARLRRYRSAKLDERGWPGDAKPEVEPIIERMAASGYVDDAAFAAARAASLQRRGYGGRRIGQALSAAGIARDDRIAAEQAVEEGALTAALRFAERKRIGPYAIEKTDRKEREKNFAAMVRAGHPIEIVHRVLNAEPGLIPDKDGI